jgi:magnesium chelatase family protein
VWPNAERYKLVVKANAYLSISEIMNFYKLSSEDNEFIELAVEKLGLSTRAHYKILKIVHTIADMPAAINIENEHIIEALPYRAMNRILRHLTQAVAV